MRHGLALYRPARPGRRSSARRHGVPGGRREVTMFPLIALPIPRPAAVVVTPVTPDRERDDRQAELRPIGVDRDPVALVDKGDASRIQPASGAVFGRNVTPAPTVQATMYLERRPCVQLLDHGVFPVGSGPKIHGSSGICVL